MIELTECIPGPKSINYMDRLKKLEAPGLTLDDSELSIVWAKSKGSKVYDVDENEYIDFASGLNVANVGHSNSEVLNSVKDQLELMVHGMGDFHSNNKKIEFLEKMKEIVPLSDPKFIVSVNGSDAVDAALKTASLFTGKSQYISFYGGYHGMGAKSLEVTARNHFRDPFTKEIPRSTIFLPYPYELRNSIGDSTNYISECLKLVEQTIENSASGSNDVAAIIIESFQGRGGVVQAPKEFLRGLREICDRTGVLLIVDEILSGMGRTGKWFGFEHSEIQPDIFTIGKGLSSGYPISVCCGNENIMSIWGKFSGESVHTSTFQGNPIGCVMAKSTIEYMQKHNLIERSEELGEYFIKRLKSEIGQNENVGEIRGKGLMIGIEFVLDKDLKKPNSNLCWSVMKKALKRGIIFLNGGHEVNVLCLTPPLIIEKNEIDYCIETLKDILEER
ncbi:aspartate aminotransferase family protein [Shouchella miscanthi]|uniref:Aspartate aminotransferase family protein n=1 Tax=Shouchella miscanthi TaxID=2598861 RepID=A0ABU6NEW1_9BACI|nr:aspartate aminotransferase family protein [Shouchella miscanthi]